jgi:hypothetical protein
MISFRLYNIIMAEKQPKKERSFWAKLAIYSAIGAAALLGIDHLIDS